MKHIVLAFSLLASPALAGVSELPAYAYDRVAEVTMATTADAKCVGISARAKRVQNHIVALYGKLAQEGIDVNAAAAHFQSNFATAQLSAREKALRKRHGVAKDGDQALCTAIRAEAKVNKALAKMVRIK